MCCASSSTMKVEKVRSRARTSKQGYSPSSAVRWFTSEAVAERLGGLGAKRLPRKQPTNRNKSEIDRHCCPQFWWLTGLVTVTGTVSYLRKKVAFFDTGIQLIRWKVQTNVPLPSAALCCDCTPAHSKQASQQQPRACDDCQAPRRTGRVAAGAAHAALCCNARTSWAAVLLAG